MAGVFELAPQICVPANQGDDHKDENKESYQQKDKVKHPDDVGNAHWAYMIIVADAAVNVCGAKKFMWSKIASHVK